MSEYDKSNKIFEEFNKHLLLDKNPSDYFNTLYEKGFFKYYPFTMLSKLKCIEQSPVYHPEGNVWNHTMLVVDNAAKLKNLSENAQVFMWLSLLHDLGKITTTKIRKGRITSYEHDKEGAVFSKAFLETCTDNQTLIDQVPKYVYFHMQPLYVYKHLSFANIEKMEQKVCIKDVALFCICDRKGRSNIDSKAEKSIYDTIIKFLDICISKIDDKHQIDLMLQLKNKI